MNAWLERLPAGNARIAVTVGVYILTALVYFAMVLSGRDDTINESLFYGWLGFLGLMAGIETADKFGKRVTDYGYVERKAAQQPQKVQVEQAVVAPDAQTVEVAHEK